MMVDALSAFLIGIISAGHCLGMCGGLTLAFGVNSKGTAVLAAYNLGRISTYTGLGFLIGAGLAWLPASAIPVLRLIASALLVLIALYYLNIASWITRVEHLALPLWRRVQPLARRWLPVTRVRQAYPLGLVWGFLPCGLVYSALGFAATAANPWASASLMLCFGLGTLPAMMLTGAAARPFQRGLNLPWVRRLLGISLLALATWLAFQAISMGH
ncbi:sulfite exporter TauE/SafE family protein [Saccharospirillum impatiens]|uniref:sulfite exporter TauE/SafE family protein n=1 Tax=Saccharospirillum impatiens TaxID=169438 RepID=UPI0003FC8763|nr:sulfite exporter TauE/SafE family protein [Saccharospirillum impatiens]